jgi:hypothetical protein
MPLQSVASRLFRSATRTTSPTAETHVACPVSGLAVRRVIISSGHRIQQFLTKSAVHVRVTYCRWSKARQLPSRVVSSEPSTIVASVATLEQLVVQHIEFCIAQQPGIWLDTLIPRAAIGAHTSKLTYRVSNMYSSTELSFLH